MRLSRLTALLLLCAAPAAWARARKPPAPAQEAAAAESDPAALALEAEKATFDVLKQAESLYEGGVGELAQGRVPEGRARLKEAFELLLTNVEEEHLAAELQADFAGMLEKVRTWEGPPTQEQDPTGLDASEDVLKALPTGSLPEGNGQKEHAIAIDPENEVVKKYLVLYTQKRKDTVEEALARSARYRPYIETELRKAGLPPELFWLVMAESEYKLHALSRAGAAGLWQFMPFTGRKYGLEVSFWVDERYHPEKATQAAIRYLSDLYQWFGDWHLAMAAYNRGENGIGRDLSFTRATDFKLLYRRGAMPLETRHYVPKFMACVLIGENPGKYGLEPRYESPDRYDEVEIDRPLDLELAAKAAGVDKEAIQRLNPHLRAWCTPPDRKGFKLRVPAGTKEKLLAHLAGVEDWNPGPSFVRYRVRRGDFLGKIALRYRTSVQNIMKLNNIRNPRLLRPGMTLKIRPGRGFTGN